MLRQARAQRKARIRAKIKGTAKRPRLAVYKSNKYIYAQLIDDQNHKTLVSSSQRQLKSKKLSNMEAATKVGEEIAKQAKKKKIKEAVFDRGGYLYHGLVKALAEAARKGGLKV